MAACQTGPTKIAKAGDTGGGDPGPGAANVAVVRRVVEEIWNGGRAEVADALFSPEYVNHGGVIPDLVRGPEAVKFSVAMLRLAFPDLHVAVDDLTVDGDTVVLRWTARNSPGGAPAAGGPSGEPGRLMETTRSRHAFGKIAESWTEWDHPDALRRLGIFPAEGKPVNDREAPSEQPDS